MNFLNLSTPKQTHDFKLWVNNIRPLCCWILKSVWDLWLSIINKSSLNSGAFWSWGGILEPQSERQPIFIPVLVLKDTWCTVRQALRALLTLVRIQDGPSAAAKTTPGTNRKSVSLNKAAEQNLATLSKQTCRDLSCGFSVEVQSWCGALCCWASGQNFKQNTAAVFKLPSIHCICSVYEITIGMILSWFSVERKALKHVYSKLTDNGSGREDAGKTNFLHFNSFPWSIFRRYCFRNSSVTMKLQICIISDDKLVILLLDFRAPLF